MITPITADRLEPSPVVGVLGMGIELNDPDDIIEHHESPSPSDGVITFVIDDASTIVLDPGPVASTPSSTGQSHPDWL